jgi:hypothetical protein
MLASNVVHLAKLLREKPYPGYLAERPAMREPA